MTLPATGKIFSVIFFIKESHLLQEKCLNNYKNLQSMSFIDFSKTGPQKGLPSVFPTSRLWPHLNPLITCYDNKGLREPEWDINPYSIQKHYSTSVTSLKDIQSLSGFTNFEADDVTS